MVFTITVKNTSAVVASAVTLRDLLPAGYSVAKPPKGARFVKGKLVINLGDLAAGASVTIRIRVRLDRTLPPVFLKVGHNPSQLVKCFTVGHFVKSLPSSLTSVSAWTSSIPSMAVRSTPVA